MRKTIIAIIIIIIIVIVLVGIYLCIKNGLGFYEGQQIMSFSPRCFFGLTAVPVEFVHGNECVNVNCPCYICAKCGDGKCGIGENWCNCPEDCKPPEVKAGWQTLNDSTYNFTIDYPTVTDQWGRLVPIDNHLKYGFATIPLEATAKNYKYLTIDINGSCDRDFENKSTEQVKINGINFIKGSEDFPQEYTDEYCIAKNGPYRLKTHWSINSGSLPSRSDFESDPIINKVLYSFKFTK